MNLGHLKPEPSKMQYEAHYSHRNQLMQDAFGAQGLGV